MRIGIDLGGTKIAGVVLAEDGSERAARRVSTPRGDYAATVTAVAALVRVLEAEVGSEGLPVGVAHPGAISPETGRVKNANSTCLNGRPLREDLAAALGRMPALANDANCLATSEAFDGALHGVESGFAVILGTGVGGALALNGHVIVGAHAIAGEWGHNPLPWPRSEWGEVPGPACWCGRRGCIETWLSGPGLAADYARAGGPSSSGEDIVARAQAGEAHAEQALARYEDRLARALAQVVNLFDPQVVVLGGGLSKLSRLYRNVPALWKSLVFTDGAIITRLLPARHGDASGVRGAARLDAGGGKDR